jgi:hypothetical protein
MAANDDIGYKKPPKHSRFKKGISGNPAGRPKGTLNIATVVQRTLLEEVVINEHGKRSTITKLEALVKQLINQAASGNLHALRHATQLTCAVEEMLAARSKSELSKRSSDTDQQLIANVRKRLLASAKREE